MEDAWRPGVRDTLNAAFARALAERPDEVFVDMAGDMRTFRDLDREAARLANGLKAFGVGRGDTVCGLTDTSMDSLLLWFAVNRLGAIWTPLNSALKGEFLRHQVEDSRARLMIIEPHYLPRIAAVVDGLSTLESLFVRGEGEPVGKMAVRSIEDLRIDGAEPLAPAIVDPRDPSLIIYTSGTTGPSKGCVVSHNYICNYGRALGWAWGLEADDVCWFALPLFHIGGLGGGIMGALSRGCRVVIAPQFSVSGFWPDIERSGATAMIAIGTMTALLAEAPDHPAAQRCFGQLRKISTAPITPAHQQKWRERFGAQHVGPPGYGLTEASFPVLHPIAKPSPPGSSGRVFEDFEVKLVDDDDVEVPVGAPGRILTRPRFGEVMFDGYWKRPEATLGAMRNLWFDTGDVGRIDEDGFFYFLDRAKDYLRRRGENISSYEVECGFLNHPDIADVAVHAVKSDVSEDDLKVTIVLKEGAMVSEEAICRWSVDQVPYYAVPRYVEFRPELPRNPTGRVLKYQLRDEGVTPATWDRQSCPDFVIKR